MPRQRYKIPCELNICYDGKYIGQFCREEHLCPACSEIKRLQNIILNLSLKAEINDKKQNSTSEADKGGIKGGDNYSNENYPKKENKKQAKTKEKTNGMSFTLSYDKSLNADTSNLISLIHYLENKRKRKVIKPQSHLPKLRRLLATFQDDDGDPHTLIKEVISYKSAEWYGTRFMKYLRPSTLFEPKNFWNYVDELGEIEEQEVDIPDEGWE